MSPDQKEFLRLEKAPGRLNAQQTGWKLGFQSHDIPVLVSAKLLEPLGHPAANSPKYFASADIELLKTDRKWLARATDAIQKHWQRKNGLRPGTAGYQP